MTPTSSHPIIFLTGASGVGKTSLVKRLARNLLFAEFGFFHFDSIEVPPVDEMIRDFGSGEAWQQSMTFEWVQRLVQKEVASGPIIFEGQINIQFVTDAFAEMEFTNYRIILVDCREEVMADRLIRLRGQAELVTADMKNWLRFLRSQAFEFEASIIETSDLTPRGVEVAFEALMDKS